MLGPGDPPFLELVYHYELPYAELMAQRGRRMLRGCLTRRRRQRCSFGGYSPMYVCATSARPQTALLRRKGSMSAAHDANGASVATWSCVRCYPVCTLTLILSVHAVCCCAHMQ